MRTRLRDNSKEEDTLVEVEFHDGAAKWPVRIWAGTKHYVSLSDEEAKHLLELLQARYPLEGLANIK